MKKPSSKRMTPLQSLAHPCSRWSATTWAVQQSDAEAPGQSSCAAIVASLPDAWPRPVNDWRAGLSGLLGGRQRRDPRVDVAGLAAPRDLALRQPDELARVPPG